MHRRLFLQWASLGWLATLVPGCLNRHSLTQTSSIPTAATPVPSPALNKTPATYVPIGQLNQLEQAGYILNETTPLGSVLVVQNSSGQTTAVNPTCPHRGCRVDWQAEQQEFLCPCHKARFSENGTVLAGPTRSNLEHLSTRIDQDTVLVSSSIDSSTHQLPADSSRQQAVHADPVREENDDGDHDTHADRDSDHD